MKSFVKGTRDIMIHNVYCTRNISPSSLDNQSLDDPLSVNTHEIFSHASAALSYTSAHHVLLGDFNIHHPNWGGASVRPNHSSLLLLSLQELHDFTLPLPPEMVIIKRHYA
jgi:exonuclease III